MAMLAEPRRKQKVINLRAKNNAWSNDSTKFGQRMLEKMGWTSGKGLGANENGITEHVIARYKNDDKGLGFQDKNDQWTKHDDDFNALLANLSNANDSTENLHSGISLEDKSKKSKARIHYHKFTRGKDISRYSEKDLANIFGKKSFKNTETVQEPLKEDLKTTEQIFTEKGSMEDYFKNKLVEFKSRSNFKVAPIHENNRDYDEPSYAFSGFSQETDDTELSDTTGQNVENNSNNIKTIINPDVASDSGNFKKKKKQSRMFENQDLCGSENENSNNEQQQLHQNECVNGKSKKKKLKNKIPCVDEEVQVSQIQQCNEEKVKKKKLKNKQKIMDIDSKELSDSHEIPIQNISDTDPIFKSKKKSKKNTEIVSENTQIDIVNESELSETQISHEKKIKEVCEEDIVPHNIKKKKSKRKNYGNVEDIQNNTNVEVIIPKKKKKKKCKEIE